MADRLLTAERVAAAPVAQVLTWLDGSTGGLTAAEAAVRLVRDGPNAIRTHRVSALAVLGPPTTQRAARLAGRHRGVVVLPRGQHPGEHHRGHPARQHRTGIVNEYRAERATAALHPRVHHAALVRRDGHFVSVDVTDLVVGDVIRLALREAVPADVRLIEVAGLECNESILSGESTAAAKWTAEVNQGAGLADSTDLAFMGTIVSAGAGVSVVYATGVNAEFGRIAAGLGERIRKPNFRWGYANSPPVAVGCAHVDRVHPHHQSVPAPAGDRVTAVRTGDSSRYHATAAGRRGEHQPGDGITATGQTQGSGQKTCVH